MCYLEMMLTGEMKMAAFVAEVKCNSLLQKQLRELIPQEAIHNPAHGLWKKISYYALETSEFDFLKHLLRMCRFDGTIGDNLDIFGSIGTVYTHMNPDIKCTNEYIEAHDLYLDVAADCFEGPEVDQIVEKIIMDAFSEKTKKSRIQRAKEAVRDCFHYENRKRPRWIQGPEWPMGETSPMKFLSQKSCGEFVDYYFCDVESGENKVVRQYY